MGIETEFDDSANQVAGERSNQSIYIDNGKYMAVVVVLAVVCGFCANVSWRMQSDFRNSSIDIEEQYQKERNHVIELEARLRVLADEVQEMKHVR